MLPVLIPRSPDGATTLPDTETCSLDTRVKTIILDFSSVNDIDIAGAAEVIKTVERLERQYRVRVLFAR